MKHIKNYISDSKRLKILSDLGIKTLNTIEHNKVSANTNQTNILNSSSMLNVALRVAQKTIAFDLVNVSPMAPPSGSIPFMDYEYVPPFKPVIGPFNPMPTPDKNQKVVIKTTYDEDNDIYVNEWVLIKK